MHRDDGVAAIQGSEGFLINAALDIGFAAPFVAAAGGHVGFHHEDVDKAEVHGDNAVAAIDALQGLLVVAFLGVFDAVPVVGDT